jgi:hypothetical protein
VNNNLSGRVVGSTAQARDAYSGIHFHGARHHVHRGLPRHIVSPPDQFLNRDKELAELNRVATRSHPVVMLKGSADIGITALALRWLSQEAERFPDDRLYADLTCRVGAAVTPADVQGRFLRALGVPPHKTPPASARRYQGRKGPCHRDRPPETPQPNENAAPQWTPLMGRRPARIPAG